MQADINITLGKVETPTGSLELFLRVEGMERPIVELRAFVEGSKRPPVVITLGEESFAALQDIFGEMRGVIKSLRDSMPDGRLPFPWVVQDPQVEHM